jgi:hypothetical protein
LAKGTSYEAPHYVVFSSLHLSSAQIFSSTPQSMFLSLCQRPSFTPIQNNRQHYSFVYSNLWQASFSKPCCTCSEYKLFTLRNSKSEMKPRNYRPRIWSGLLRILWVVTDDKPGRNRLSHITAMW